MKRFIVIELQSPDFPVITTDEDGAPQIYETIEAANKEADDCQNGFVVELSE